MTIHEHPTLRHAIGTEGLIVVRVHDGDVRIRGVDGDEVRIRSRDGQELDRLAVEPGDGRVTIGNGRDGHGRSGGHRGGAAPDVDLEVPRGASVVVDGRSGDVEADGLTGDFRFHTASGDLRLRDVRGHVTAEAMSGDMDISADGPIEIQLRSVSGDVAVRAASIARLHVSSTSGDMHIAGRFDGDGPYVLHAVSGDTVLAPLGDVRVEARTITGDVRSEIPARTEEVPGGRSIIIGGKGPTIDVRSTSGDVRLVAASLQDREAAPDDTADLARLGILRALERGEIDVSEARGRLDLLDQDGPGHVPDGAVEADHA